MRRIATDNPVAWYRSLSVARLRCAKTAERTEMMFGVKTWVGWRLVEPKAHCIKWDPHPLQQGDAENYAKHKNMALIRCSLR